MTKNLFRKLYKNRQFIECSMPIFGASQCSEQYKLRICIHDATPEKYNKISTIRAKKALRLEISEVSSLRSKGRSSFCNFQVVASSTLVTRNSRSRQCCCFKYSRHFLYTLIDDEVFLTSTISFQNTLLRPLYLVLD